MEDSEGAAHRRLRGGDGAASGTPRFVSRQNIGYRRGSITCLWGRRCLSRLIVINPSTRGAPQGKFLEDVLTNVTAKFRFIALHHGPLSSGRHGGSEAGPYLMEVADRFDVTAVLAGHDHLYERIVQRDVTVVVSGGGGAPLYQRWGHVEGSVAFMSTYHWVLMKLEGDEGTLEAYGLEGTLLDRGKLPAKAQKRPRVSSVGAAAIGGAIMLLGLAFVLYRIVFSVR